MPYGRLDVDDRVAFCPHDGSDGSNTGNARTCRTALSAPVRSPVHETESASDCPRHDSEAPHLNYWQGYYPPPHPFSYHSVAPYSRHYRFFYGDCCCSAETFGLGAGGGLGTLNFRN